MTTFDDWAARCTSTDRGRLFLDNLGIDLELNFLDDRALKKFRSGLVSPPGASPISTMAEAASSAVENAAVFLKGKKRNRTKQALAHVFQLDRKMASRWFDPTRLGGLGRYDGPEELLDLVRRAGGIGTMLRHGAELRGRLPVVWLAFDSELTQIMHSAAVGHAGNVVRDALGLLHYQEDQYLCRIVLPSSDVGGMGKRRPTAFDAGANLVFRSNKVNETFGRAIHLATGMPSLREVVTAPVPLTPAHTMEAIGRISQSAAFSWSDMARSTDPLRIDRTVARFRAATP